MKKTILTMFMLVAGSVFAEDYLFWMVDQSNSGSAETYLFDYATLREGGSQEFLCLANGDKELSSDATRLGTGEEAAYSVVDKGYAGTYFFELWTDDVGGGSTRAAYAMVSSDLLSGYIYGNMGQAGASPYVVTAAQLIPEPTSGLLMVLGVAMLALRRRRADTAA